MLSFEASVWHTQGSKYLGFGGICRGIGLTRTGWLTPCERTGQHEDRPSVRLNTYPVLRTVVRSNR